MTSDAPIYHGRCVACRSLPDNAYFFPWFVDTDVYSWHLAAQENDAQEPVGGGVNEPENEQVMETGEVIDITGITREVDYEEVQVIWSRF